MCNEEIWSEICKNGLDILREDRGVRKKRQNIPQERAVLRETLREMVGIFMLIYLG